MSASFEALDLQIEALSADPNQPRRQFDGLEPLAATIKAAGILQPIVVRPHPDGVPGKWMIVLGERRWRAARIAGLATVPAINRTDIDDKVFFLQLVENLSDYRHPLEAYERAVALQKFVDECGGVESAGKMLGQNKDWFSRETALVRVSTDVWKHAEKAKIHDKRTILDLHRLVKHTGRSVEDEWENIKSIGLPARDALHARMEASGAMKKRPKKDKGETPLSANDAAPAASTGQPDVESTSVKIAPGATGRKYRRKGLDEWVRLAEEKFGLDSERDFEGFLEAILLRAVPAEMEAATAA